MPSQRAVRATSIRGDGRRKSVVTTKQSRQPPLNDDAPGLVALRLIGAVGGIEADHRPFTAGIFERLLLPIDPRDAANDLPRGVGLLAQGIVGRGDGGRAPRRARTSAPNS